MARQTARPGRPSSRPGLWVGLVVLCLSLPAGAQPASPAVVVNGRTPSLEPPPVFRAGVLLAPLELSLIHI